jgi:enoyl-CoA hydratase/carnithine racemase
MVPDIVKDLEEDGEIHVIILQGAGDQAFEAGADISQFKDRQCNMDDEAFEYQGVAASPLGRCALDCTGNVWGFA